MDMGFHFTQKQLALKVRLCTQGFMDSPLKEGLEKHFHRARIIKSGDQSSHIVYGIVYEPDVKDAHGEWADAPTILRSAHKFMSQFQQLNFMHEVPLEKRQATIVESYIAPCDFEMGGQTVKMGTWILAAQILDPKLWAMIADGTITGWSLEGLAAYAEDPNGG